MFWSSKYSIDMCVCALFLAVENNHEDFKAVTPRGQETSSFSTETTPLSSGVMPTQPMDISSDLSDGGSGSKSFIESNTRIVIKRGRGAAKTLDLNKLQMPLQQG